MTVSNLTFEHLMEDVQEEVHRQDRVHPSGYPSTRDGVRLALACADDELKEALGAWRADRCKCDVPNCAHADWSEVEFEAIQLIAVLVRMLAPIRGESVA